jgi:hypothetical protein
MSQLLYTPPSGYYDAPFTWVYDGSGLVDGSDALNQMVSIYAGYGDFVLRRVVALFNLLNVTGGQFQIYDALERTLRSVPANLGSSDEFAVVPEVLYKENSKIKFDLWDVARNIFPPVGGGQNISLAQIYFHGVRRKPGNGPQPSYEFRPKTLTYTVTATINRLGSLNPLTQGPSSAYQLISDYDFDLYQVILTAKDTNNNQLNGCVFAQLYDSDKQVISNLPVEDLVLSAGTTIGSTYNNGAIVPPLFFPIGSQLHADLFSYIDDPARLPVTVTVHFVGMRRYPC